MESLQQREHRGFGSGIPIPVNKGIDEYHPSSSEYFSSSDESAVASSRSVGPHDHLALCTSNHGCLSGGVQLPFNMYGTSPRTSVMFNYYSSSKGNYAQSRHPSLMRARSTDGPSHSPILMPLRSQSEDHSIQGDDDNLDENASNNSREAGDPLLNSCKISGKLCRSSSKEVSPRPRAWSESDKNHNTSLQNSRVSVLRKLKMKLAQKGGFKRQKSQEEEEKILSLSAIATSLRKLEEGHQLDCSSSGRSIRLQGCTAEFGKIGSVRQEHETRIKPERRVGVVRYTSPPQHLPRVRENPGDFLVYQRFLEEHTCYDLMPTSSKLVVLDTRLEVKKAFHVLIENSLKCAPLWNCDLQSYVGLLTVSDFVGILLAYHKCPDKKLEDLEDQKISCWRKILNSKKVLIHVPPQASLLDALRCLKDENIKRLAVVHPDNGDIFHVINHRRILHFLNLFVHELPKPDYMSLTIADLDFGIDRVVATVSEDSPVIDALKLLDEHKVSCLPVVDAQDRVTDMFTKTDVLVLAGEQLFYDLSIRVKSVISLHAVVELDSDVEPTVNRMIPVSPTLVRRKSQPLGDYQHPRTSSPVKVHPFLRNADNPQRLIRSPMATFPRRFGKRRMDSKKTKDKGHHHTPNTAGTSAGKENSRKGDSDIICPTPSAPQVFLHRRRHLSSYKKSTSISSHLVTVTKEDTLECVMNSIVTTDVLQAVVVDDFDHVQGVISISDILGYMVSPRDKSGEVVRPNRAKKPPIGQSPSDRLSHVPKVDGRVRAASDDTDQASSVARLLAGRLQPLH